MRNSLLYVLSIFSLSQAANLVRLADAPALMIGFWRLLFSAAILLPFLIWTSHQQRDQKTTMTQSLFSAKFFGFTALSALFFFGHLWTFFLAAQMTSIANCMILFCLNPLFTAFISSKFLGVDLPKKLYFAYPIAFAGLVVLLWQDLGEQTVTSSHGAGDLFAILSGTLYSGYILSSMHVRKTTSNIQFATVMYALTSLLFLIFCFLYRVPLINYPSITWLAILGNVLIPTLLGHFLFTYLVRFLNVNLMSCGKLIEPAFSSLVAFYVFQEKLKPGIYLAFFLTSTSLLILFSDHFRRNKMPDPKNQE